MVITAIFYSLLHNQNNSFTPISTVTITTTTATTTPPPPLWCRFSRERERRVMRCNRDIIPKYTLMERVPDRILYLQWFRPDSRYGGAILVLHCRLNPSVKSISCWGFKILPPSERGLIEWILTAGCGKVNSRLNEIQVPVLAVAGTSDLLLPSKEEAFRFSREIPQCKVNLVEGAGHAGVLDQRVDLTKIITGLAVKWERWRQRKFREKYEGKNEK